MAKPEIEQVEAHRVEGQNVPIVRQVQVRKIEADFTLSATIDRFLGLASEALAQGKIGKADYAELVRLSYSLRAVLEKIGERELLAAGARNRARRRYVRSPSRVHAPADVEACQVAVAARPGLKGILRGIILAENAHSSGGQPVDISDLLGDSV